MKKRTPTSPSKKSQCAITAAVLGMSMVSSSHLHAATLYWDGVDGTWSATSNWSTVSGATTPNPTSAPGVSDDVVFNITTANNVNQEVSLNSSNRSANSILLNNAGTTFFRRLSTDATDVNYLQVGTDGFTMSSTSGAVTLGQNVSSGQKVGLRAATGSTSLSITNDSSSLLTLNQGTQTRTGDINLASTITFAGSGSGGINQVGAIGRATTSDGSVAVTVNRSGTGVVTFESTNDYTGATTVTAGTLVINGNISTSVITTVASGATLGGSGTVGVATISGILSPGNSIGTLTATGDVTWNANQPWIFELGVSAANPTLAATTGTRDLLDITGTGSDFLKGTGSTFTFDFANTGETGFYKLVDWTGTSTFIDGDFTATNLASGLSGSFIVDTDTTALYLNVIPEPSAALLGGIGMLFLLRRRRA